MPVASGVILPIPPVLAHRHGDAGDREGKRFQSARLLELRGQIAAMIAQPATKLARTIAAPGQQLALVLAARRDQLGKA